MAQTQVWDMDEEPLLRHFCLEEECEEVKTWLKEQGHERPEDFEGRLLLSKKLRELGNESYKANDFKAAMLYALSALHCLDFSKARTVVQNEQQKQEALQELVPVVSNLSMIFLKRGDNHNALRAADLGIERASKLTSAEADRFKAKLFFRRGLTHGQEERFVKAHDDLLQAARLQPESKEIRDALAKCKVHYKKQAREENAFRGVYTSNPQVARWRAKVYHTWETALEVKSEVLRLVLAPEGLKVIVLLILGPLIGMLGPILARQLLR